MLQNAYLLEKIGADTAENEQHFAEILPRTGNYPTALPVPDTLYPTGAGGKSGQGAEPQRSVWFDQKDLAYHLHKIKCAGFFLGNPPGSGVLVSCRLSR